jgi:hypothetical protein
MLQMTALSPPPPGVTGSGRRVTLTLPEKPAVLPVNDGGIPDELKAISCWLGWRHQPVRDKAAGGWTWKKPPYTVHGGKRGGKADPTDPESGAPFADTWAAYQAGQVDGVGLQLHPVHGLFAVDLDHCVHPVTGEISRRAAAVLRVLPTYAELSPCWADPDGGGVRLIGRGALPSPVKKTWFEAYDRDRYVTLTGHRFAEAPAAVRDCPRLPKLYRRVMGVPAPQAGGDISHAANVAHGGGYARANQLSDEALLDVMFASATTGAATRALWNGDDSAHGGDASRADLALASDLWYWTNGVSVRVDRLFRRSGRMRPKWDERHDGRGRTYGEMTIAKAAERRVAAGSGPKLLAAEPSERPAFRMPEPITELTVAGGDMEWVWDGYIAPGCTTLITAHPKCGKTTLLGLLFKALESGGEFCGAGVASTGVVVVSEEPEAVWVDRRDRLGLSRNLWRSGLPFKGRATWAAWEEYLAVLAEHCRQHKIGLVVLDTISKCWPIEDENDAVQVNRGLLPLGRLTEAGCAVLLVHHPRKSDGAEGTAARGSSALTGGVDIMLELRRHQPGDRRRELKAYSRFDAPDPLVIELAADGLSYAVVSGGATPVEKWAPLISSVLVQASGPMTIEDILVAWPAGRNKPSDSTLRRVVKDGAGTRWSQSGRGTKTNPHRYQAIAAAA